MKYFFTVLALALSGLALAVAAENVPREDLRIDAGDKSARQQIADLKSGIAKLQAELETFKQRLESLENAHRFRIQPVPAPALRSSIQPVPPNWERREFNGQQYFIIPLAKDPPGTD